MATIHYYDIGDYLDREEKLAKIKEFKSIENVPWQIITPNAKHDWINQRNEEFDTFLAIGDKEEKGKGGGTAVFDVFSRGVASGRDAWCYNFSSNELTKNMKRMVAFYNEQVQTYKERQEWDNEITVENFIDTDPTKIAWTRELKWAIERKTAYQFKKNAIVTSMYRPFCKAYAYFDRNLNSMVYQMPRIFPAPDADNMVIYVCGVGATKDFSTIIVNALPDIHLLANGQCFPYWIYEPECANGSTALLLAHDAVPKRRENITDSALQKFQTHYAHLAHAEITKRDIFWYIYGILNCRSYQERFAAELKKQLPRVPFAADFWGFAEAGKKLAELHLNYETLKPFALREVQTSHLAQSYHVTQMKFPSKTDKTKIIYNSFLTLDGIPPDTYRYIVNGKSALEWIMERYQITTHKDSGITNDPNDWATETGDESYIVELVKRIVTLSVESVKIIDAMPELVF